MKIKKSEKIFRERFYSKAKFSEKIFLQKSRNDSVAAGSEKGGAVYYSTLQPIQAQNGRIVPIFTARAAFVARVGARILGGAWI